MKLETSLPDLQPVQKSKYKYSKWIKDITLRLKSLKQLTHRDTGSSGSTANNSNSQHLKAFVPQRKQQIEWKAAYRMGEKELNKLNSKKKKKQPNWANKRAIKMSSYQKMKHKLIINICSIFLDIKEMKIKTTLRFYFILIRMAATKKIIDNKF